MEDYDLRSCFQPDLSGLHLRIYQFQELLHQHLPVLAAHLDHLQVEAAYLSQWFLSFFAVTCPLPMLFRIYDVIFAEGASETIMRVALSVMRKNEQKILNITEFEDVMQLLLSRALWDPYGLSAKSADELVDDFVSFTSLVTRENLRELDASFKAAQRGDSSAKVGFFPEVQKAASGFLGRLWAPSNTPTKSPGSTLSPNGGLTTPAASSRPGSFLRRTPSKQSLASTHNSTEAGSDSTMSSSSTGTTITDATSLSRVASDDYEASIKSGKTQTESLVGAARSVNKDKDLHTQIEDLLMALSEMQREHAQLAAQLAKEREEREEDGLVVRGLLDALSKEKRKSKRLSDHDGMSKRKTAPVARAAAGVESDKENTATEQGAEEKRVSSLISRAEYRFPLAPPHHRRSVTTETKSQLRSALAQAREHIATETSRATDLTRQLEAKEQETSNARDELREARGKIRNEFAERQRLEKVIKDLRADLKTANATSSVSSSPPRKSIMDPSNFGMAETPSGRSRSPSGGSKGLRELKLGRSQTMGPSASGQSFSKRSSSLATQAVLSSLSTAIPSLPSMPSAGDAQTPIAEEPSQDQQDRDALLLELVNAKTAEAIARQELDEMRGRFDAMRRMLAASQQQSPAGSNTNSPASTPGPGGHKATPSEGWVSFVSGAAGAARDRVAGAMAAQAAAQADAAAEKKVDEKAGGWGGWGWGKRVVS